MDINEGDKLQCFNCHKNIFYSDQKEESKGVCQLCLSAESTQTTTWQTSPQNFTQHLAAIQDQFIPQLQHYTYFCHKNSSLQQLELKFAQLELEEMHLTQQETKISNELSEFKEQLVNSQKQLENSSNQLHLSEIHFQSLLKKQKEGIQSEVELKNRRKKLEKLSLLNELYRIHFEDKAAFINREPLTHSNSLLLVEILNHLMEIYQYKCGKDIETMNHENSLSGKYNVSLNFSSPESTLPWLSLVVQETQSLWTHIKEETRKKNRVGFSKGVSLPFPISLEPEISVGDIYLRAGSGYQQLLKCLAHQLKFLVSFEFSLRQ